MPCLSSSSCTDRHSHFGRKWHQYVQHIQLYNRQVLCDQHTCRKQSLDQQASSTVVDTVAMQPVVTISNLKGEVSPPNSMMT